MIKPPDEAKLLQVISFWNVGHKTRAKLAFKLTKLIHRFCQNFRLGLWPLGKRNWHINSRNLKLVSKSSFFEIFSNIFQNEGKVVENLEYSSSIPSSSQFSSSSVQSKDTINTQISRNTLEPPSPFPHVPRTAKTNTDLIVCHNNTRRPSTVSFSFRKNSITPNGLLRYVGKQNIS